MTPLPAVDPTFGHATEIGAADSFAQQDRLKDAAALYRRVVAECENALAGEENYRDTRAQLYLVADRIGRLAERSLLAGDYADALECADQALQYDPYSTSFNLQRAHALMLLRRADEARAIYVTYEKKRMPDGKFGEYLITNAFEQLREAGHASKLMDDVARHFKETLWNQKSDQADGVKRRDNPAPGGEYRPAVKHRATPASTAPIPLHERDDLAAAEELFSEGRLEEAVVVFKRRIDTCDRVIAKRVPNLQSNEDRHKAVVRLSDVALEHVLRGDDEKALEVTEFALSVVPNSPLVTLRRAHALMLLGKPQEARDIYLRYRAEKITAELTAENIILGDFGRMRQNARLAPLMDEIETAFGQRGGRSLTR